MTQPDTCADAPSVFRWGDAWYACAERMHDCLPDAGQVHTVGFLHHRCLDLDADLWARPQGLIPSRDCAAGAPC